MAPLRHAYGLRECLFIREDQKWPADRKNGAHDPKQSLKNLRL